MDFHLPSEPLFQIGVSVKNQNRTANSVDSDELFHLNLRCLRRYLYRTTGLIGLSLNLAG